MLTSSRIRRRQAGLTLVELMIALVIGLIVLGAAIALVVSLMRANNESVRAMRLTQELRALSEIVTTEVRRARSLTDPLSNVGQGTGAFTACNAITPAAGSSGSCLLFAYRCDPSDSSGQYRMVRQAGGDLILGSGTAALSCASDGVQLNSDELALDQVNFTQTAEGAIQITLAGHLTTDPAATQRTITRVIWPRSAPVVP